MRSFSLASSRSWQFPAARISSIAVDVDEDSVFVVSECPNNNADVELEVFKVARREDSEVSLLAYLMLCGRPIVT